MPLVLLEKLTGLKRIRYGKYKYWIDRSGNPYVDLFHALVLRVVSPSLVSVEARRNISELGEQVSKGFEEGVDSVKMQSMRNRDRD